MELRQLQYFAAVARHGHFGRAADELHLTQSALSQQVARLEAELGLTLLRRTSRGAELLPAGEDLLGRAESILAEVGRARAEMDAHAGMLRGVARVATTATDGMRLPGAVAAFRDEHPAIRVTVRVGTADEVVAALRRGTADIGLLAVLSPPDGLRTTPLAGEPLRLALPSDDPLAAPGAPVALAALRDRPLVLPRAGTALRETVMAACARAGFSPVPPLEASEPEALLGFVRAGLGVGVVPASWIAAGATVASADLEPPVPHVGPSLLTAAGSDRSGSGALLHDRLAQHLGQLA